MNNNLQVYAGYIQIWAEGFTIK